MEDNSVRNNERFWTWVWRTTLNSHWSVVGWFVIGNALVSFVLVALGVPLWIILVGGGIYGWCWTDYTRPYFFPRED